MKSRRDVPGQKTRIGRRDSAMNIDIAIFLIKDGIGNGAIYSMIALGIVLIFNVTRIVLVSYGDLLAYSALTLAAIQSGQLPGTVWILLLFAAVALVLEIFTILRRNEPKRLMRAVMLYGVLPAAPALLMLMLQGQVLPMLLQVVLTVALIVPFGPLIYRIVFRPIADASVLVLLMAAVALHFVLSGLALQAFGAEGFRTKAYATGTTHILGIVVPASLLVIVAAVFAFILGLYYSLIEPSSARHCAQPLSMRWARGLSASGRRSPVQPAS